jgi:RNA polymerase sigma-70 factor (ECF subfamily)
LPRVRHVRREDSECRTDQELVHGIRAGDEIAFAVLYDRYFQRIYNFAYTRLRNRADAEEAAQDTFTAVFRSIGGFRGSASLLSWVYGIARNTVNNQIRRARAHEQRVERAQTEIGTPGLGVDEYSPEESLSYQRCAHAVERALTSVTSWQAEVFVLRHFENLPIQEIADRMDRSNDAVRSSLYRVKKLVVDALESEGSGAD